MTLEQLRSEVCRLRARHGAVSRVAFITDAANRPPDELGTILVDAIGHTEHIYGETFEEAIARADAYISKLVTAPEKGDAEYASWGMAA